MKSDSGFISLLGVRWSYLYGYRLNTSECCRIMSYQNFSVSGKGKFQYSAATFKDLVAGRSPGMSTTYQLLVSGECTVYCIPGGLSVSLSNGVVTFVIELP
jgi:hypothetical protein